MFPSRDEGMTFLELLIVVALIGIIAAFAVPRLIRARAAANEASAIASLRAVATAELVYSRSCGGGAYASSLETLGVPPPGMTLAFLSPDMTGSAAPAKSGYTYSLAPGLASADGPPDCNGTPTSTAFYASAVPQSFGLSGRRSFALNTNRTLWQVTAATAPTEPFGAPAIPLN